MRNFSPRAPQRRSHQPRRWVFRGEAHGGAEVAGAPARTSDNGDALARLLRLHPVVARILDARGMQSPELARSFLNPKLSDLLDPFLLKDMDLAADRLLRAVRNGERICVYGDYDVDGLTATAVMHIVLEALHGDVFSMIPNRLRDGYGLTQRALETCQARGAKVVLTVDNGISAVEEIAWANRHGLDVIVTDHHQPDAGLPEAVAVVNPNRPDAYYPHARLSGAGVAFKLAHALLRISGIPPEEGRNLLGLLLELVALGTLADIVPLQGENRILARWGLDRLGRTERAGLRALLEQAGCNGKPTTAYTVGFVLGPRLNAAGRTADPELSLQLLLSTNPAEAMELARRLDHLNQERRDLELDILKDSIEFLQTGGHLESDSILIAQGEGWHFGVLGIVAARLVERYNRPVVVLTLEGDIARGSARSIRGYDIHEALGACKCHLINYGGHAAAAGLRLHRNTLDEFRAAINHYARNTLPTDFEPAPVEIDTRVEAAEIDIALYNDLRALEPHGQENPEPVLALLGAKLIGTPRILSDRHLRFQVQAQGRPFSAIGFNLADCNEICRAGAQNLDIAFSPRLNTWRGDTNLELEVRDLRPGQGN